MLWINIFGHIFINSWLFWMFNTSFHLPVMTSHATWPVNTRWGYRQPGEEEGVSLDESIVASLVAMAERLVDIVACCEAVSLRSIEVMACWVELALRMSSDQIFITKWMVTFSAILLLVFLPPYAQPPGASTSPSMILSSLNSYLISPDLQQACPTV